MDNFENIKNRIELQKIVLDSIPAKIYAKDKDLYYISCNPAFYISLGLSEEEVLYKCDYDLYDLETAESNIKKDSIIIKTGIPNTAVEMSHVFEDGPITWNLVNRVPYRDSAGTVIGVVVTSTDVTNQKSLEENLKNAIKDANIANEAKSEFLANMSHEIRTPMNGIIGMISMLEKTTLNEIQEDYVDIMRSSSFLLLELINDILDISKIEAGKLSLETVPFNLESIVRSLEKMMKLEADKKSVSLDIIVDKRVPKILSGDPVRIKQILINLISNSIKFTDYGYVKVNININKEDNNEVELCCAVEDSGIGISEKNIGKLFKSFTQSDSSITRRFGGSGLGLAISKTLVELMDGTISVKSEEGKGSVFTFTCIIKKNAIGITSEESYTNKKDKNNSSEYFDKIKLLLVEDNKVNQKVASYLLNSHGINVDIADNGEIALSKILEDDYDIILMDINMPVMDGYSATRLIRNDEKYKKYSSIPIIAMTGNALKGEKDKALEIGIDAYLTKPINEDDLINTLESIINPSVPNYIQSQSQDISTFDKEELLKKLGNDKDIYNQIINLFIEETSNKLKELEVSVSSLDYDNIFSIAHYIKGAAGNITANIIQDYALKLENAGRDKSSQNIQGLFLNLSKEFDFFKEKDIII